MKLDILFEYHMLHDAFLPSFEDSHEVNTALEMQLLGREYVQRFHGLLPLSDVNISHTTFPCCWSSPYTTWYTGSWNSITPQLTRIHGGLGDRGSGFRSAWWLKNFGQIMNCGLGSSSVEWPQSWSFLRIIWWRREMFTEDLAQCLEWGIPEESLKSQGHLARLQYTMNRIRSLASHSSVICLPPTSCVSPKFLHPFFFANSFSHTHTHKNLKPSNDQWQYYPY